MILLRPRLNEMPECVSSEIAHYPINSRHFSLNGVAMPFPGPLPPPPPVGRNFEVQQSTLRSDATIWTSGNFGYVKTAAKGNKIYLSCRLRSSCPARAHVNTDTLILTLRKAHNCGSSLNLDRRKFFRKKRDNPRPPLPPPPPTLPMPE